MRRLVSYSSKLRAPSPIHAINLVLDFDGTLTKSDTLQVVAKAGYDVQARYNVSPPPPPWRDIVDAYLADYKAHSEPYKPSKSQRLSVRQEVEWLNSLQRVEEASAQRALKAGIFDNVQRSDVFDAAREAVQDDRVKLRDGYSDLISYINKRNGRLPESITGNSISANILSVNWSATFIYAIITETIATSSNPSSWVNTLQIYANEIPSVTTDTASTIGRYHTEKPIRTSGDKLQQFQILSSTFPYSNTRTIYVGDSTTDLECLLAAHTGICIREHDMGSSQRDLAETCERIGIDVRPIREKPDLDKSDNVLWWAYDFAEIQQWIESMDTREINGCIGVHDSS